MNSKSIPMVLGMLVLLAGGAWLIGRNLVSPPGGSGGTDTAGALEPDVPPKQAEARQLAQAGKLNEAQTMLAELLEFDPSNVSAAIDLGMILEQQGVPDAALDLAEKVLQIQPENSDGHLLRSRALVALDRFDEAELTCLRALEISPSNIAARYTIGLVRTAQGRPDRAIDAYLRAMGAQPDQQTVLSALADLNELALRKPDMATVQYSLAFFANTLGAKDEELEALKRFLDLQESGPAAEIARQKVALLEQTVPR